MGSPDDSGTSDPPYPFEGLGTTACGLGLPVLDPLPIFHRISLFAVTLSLLLVGWLVWGGRAVVKVSKSGGGYFRVYPLVLSVQEQVTSLVPSLHWVSTGSSCFPGVNSKKVVSVHINRDCLQ